MKSKIRNLILITITIMMLFSSIYPAVYAEPDETAIEETEDTDGSKSKILTEDDEYDMSVHAYDSQMMEKMMRIMFDNYEQMYPDYTNDPDTVQNVPHATLTRIDGMQQATAELDDKFLQVKKPLVARPVQYMTSRFATIPQNSTAQVQFLWMKHKIALPNWLGAGETNNLTWQGNDKDILYFRNYYTNLMLGNTPAARHALQIDSYGNIITNTQNVVLPFFMQDDFASQIIKHNDDLVGVPNVADGKLTSLIKNFSEVTFIPFVPDEEIIDNAKALFADPTNNAYMRPFYINSSGQVVDLAQALGEEDGRIHASKVFDFLDNGGTIVGRPDLTLDKAASRQFIADNYYPMVEEFNAKFLERAEEVKDIPLNERDQTTAVYLGPTSLGDTIYSKDFSVGDGDNNLEKLITTLLKGGAGKFLQLTVAYVVVEVYQELFIDFSSKYIFHTDNFVESNFFNNMFGAYVVIVIFIIILNILVSAINIMRGQTTVGKTTARVFIIVFVTTVPIFLYSAAIDYVFNELPSNIMKTEMEQMMILDRWTELAKQDSDERRLTDIPFIISDDFRGSSHNYLIDFNTNQFVDDAGKEQQSRYLDGRQKYYEDTEVEHDEYIREELSNSNMPRVQLYVDANHLMNYFKDSTQDTLFAYLSTTYNTEYAGLSGGIREYTEYEKFLSLDKEEEILDQTVFTERTLTSSQLGKKVYGYYEQNSSIDTVDRLNMIADYMANYSVTPENINRLIERASDIPMIENKQYYDSLSETDFNNTSDYEAFVAEKEIMEAIGYGDITGVYGLLKEITVVDDGDIITDTLDGAISAAHAKKVRQIVKEINENTINNYISTTSTLLETMGTSSYDELLVQSMNDVNILNIYFEISKSLGGKYFPDGVLESKIESDVYIRNLVIPLRDMTPYNTSIENAAIYVGANKSTSTLAVFIIMIVLIATYGLTKLIVVGIILMPAILILLLWNYILKEDYDNKLWFGAAYILAVFAAVHWGFVILWKFAAMNMNSGITGVIGSRTSFFTTFTNSLVVCVYFAIALKFMIYPTVKTAIKNPTDLGGATQFENAKKVGGKLLTGISSGLSQIGLKTSVKPKGKPGQKETSGDRPPRDKTTEALRKEKNMMDSEKTAGEDDANLANDIKKGIDKRKKGLSEEDIEKVATPTDVTGESTDAPKRAFKINKSSGGLFGKVADKIYNKAPQQAMESVKEQLNRLKKYGKFASKAVTEKLTGNTSNKIGVGNPIVAKSISKVMDAKKIENTVKDDTIHFNADEDFLTDIEPDIKDHIEKSKEELKTVATDEGTNVTGSHIKDLSVSFDSNPDISDQLSDLISQGIVKSYKDVEQHDVEGNIVGMRTVVQAATGKAIKQVQQLVTEYGSTDITESLKVDSTVYAKDNQATFEALKILGIDNYEEVQEDGENFIKIEVTPTKAATVAEEIETVGRDIADVENMDIERTKYIKLNSNNDIVRYRVEVSTNIQEGVDYMETGGEYVSISEDGYNELRNIEKYATNSAQEITEAFDSIGEVTISASNMYKNTEKANGLKHVVQDLTYETGEILSSINEINDYSGNSEQIRQIQKVIKDITDIRAENDRLVVYTHSNVSNEQLTDTINELQKLKYEQEKLAESQRKKQDDVGAEKGRQAFETLNKRGTEGDE